MAENNPTGSVALQPSQHLIRAYGGAAPPPQAAPSLSLTLPPSMSSALENLVVETGKPIGEIVAGALGLYMLALKAHQEGKAIGAATTSDVLDTEFVGF